MYKSLTDLIFYSNDTQSLASQSQSRKDYIREYKQKRGLEKLAKKYMKLMDKLLLFIKVAVLGGLYFSIDII